jgi:hypothetical protein
MYAPMKVVEFLKIGRELLKLMSSFDLKCSDYKYIELYDEYMKMRVENEKVDYILCFLSSKYSLSESTIKRIIKRLSKEFKN